MGITKVYISEVPPIVLRNPGKDGTSGTSGVSGAGSSSGTSGTSGKDGTFFGTSGTSGRDGTAFGTSGTSGISGTSGVNGSNGTSGISGTSGIDGTNGTDGVDGSHGTSGTSGFSIDSGSFVTTGSFNSFTTSVQTLSASFDLRIKQATNEQDLSYLATTGSNTFVGNQTISGSIYLEQFQEIKVGPNNSINNGEGSLYIRENNGVITLAPYDEFDRATLLTLLSDTVQNDILRLSNQSGVAPELVFDKSGSLNIRAVFGTGSLLINNTPYDAHLATTGSNVFSGSQYISGSLIPATGNGTFTSSFSLGSITNAWKDLYISHGSIVFVDAVTQATSSFTIAANQEVQYSNGITASYYEGDGSRLVNLPSTTNWNKREFTIKKTEQLTFSGDYILEDSYLVIEGSVPNSIGEWTNVNPDDNDGRITRTSNNTYRIDGANDDSGSGQVYIKRFFNTPTTMSIVYEWRNEDEEEDWPIFEVSVSEPTGSIDDTNMLDNNSAGYETGSWTINIPANNWLAIGVYSTDSCCGSGSLNITLPYLFNDDIIQYAENKYFKKEGSLFIGGNLLVKDSFIENNGKISVGGEVILIGNSEITGTGTII